MGLCWRSKGGTVATYEYRCDQDGLFDISRRLGTAPESAACPICGGDARRVFSVSMVRSGSRPGWVAAMDRADKSRFEPDVVTSLPPLSAANRMPALQMTPALRRLPRP